VIDLNKLPFRALLDSGVLMRALGDRPEDPDAPICKEFWDKMLFRNNDIYIAAPTVTEVTRSSKYPALTIPSVELVTVVAFDRLAADILAKKYPQPVTKNLCNGLPIDYIRYDAMIAACADRYRATLITLEVTLTRVAKEAGIACARPHDFESVDPPEAQTSPSPDSAPPALGRQMKMLFGPESRDKKNDPDETHPVDPDSPPDAD
jgi:predicted nucleic acid-binding protein